jgi:chitinase
VSCFSIFRILIHSLFYSWEYPGKQGIGCNVVSPNDTANFLSFLQTLRAQEGAHNITVSAAVADSPFIGPGGTSLSDVSEFAKVLDYIGTLSATFISALTFV